MNLRKIDFYLLGLIIISFFARFWHLSDWSLSNDELSAISRLNYNSLKDLVYYGVMTNDMHPAGVQVFLYYWTKCFEITEFWLRFPFALAGVIAVVYFYLLLKKIFSKEAAFLGGLFIALLQFTVLYSQLARPYSPGLLFVMMFAYYWYAFFIEDNKKLITMFLFGASAVLAAITHNYSFLVVLIMGISGLVFMNKSKILPLLITVVASFVVYLPNFKVFYFQMGIGGVGGWLGKPKNDWIIDFLYFSFNQSLIIAIVALVLFAISIYYIIKNPISKSKMPLLFLFWFIVSFLIGFYYSRLKNPILQYSTLVFTFPFLIAFIVYGIDLLKEKLKKVAIICIAVICSYSFVFEQTSFKESTFGDFKGLAKEIVELNKTYKSDSIERIIQLNNPNYINFYLKKEGSTLEFSQYINHGEEEKLIELKKIVQNSNKPYFMDSYLLYQPSIIEDIISSEYPYIIYNTSKLGYTVRLFSRKSNQGEKLPLLEINNDFESADCWTSKIVLDTVNPINGIKSFIMSDSLMYGPTIRIPYSDLKNANYFIASVDFIADTVLADVSMDCTISNADSTLSWQSRPFRYFDKAGKLSKLIYSLDLPSGIKSTDIVSFYISNAKLETVKIDDFNIKFYRK
ncbi:MAG: glycosyltransferase family 39 protein [Bacteroidota bacterium]